MCFISVCAIGLQATLFVRHPRTGKIFLNLDPGILQLLSESEMLIKMCLDVPPAARELCLIGDDIKKNYCSLKAMTHTISFVIFLLLLLQLFV